MPRDPDRIPEILGWLTEAWAQHPDQRFLQLLTNIIGTSDSYVLFYLEDDVLLERIAQFQEKHQPNENEANPDA